MDDNWSVSERGINKMVTIYSVSISAHHLSSLSIFQSADSVYYPIKFDNERERGKSWSQQDLHYIFSSK